MIEGMDGAGKTTALQTLADWVQSSSLPDQARSAVEVLRSRSVVFLREPTALPTGAEIRRRLASSTDTDYRQWIKLFRADREANLREFVKPALEQGSVVLQDRYLYSTAAYQGAFAECGPLDVLAEFADFPLPDLLIFLDITEELAFARMKLRKGQREVFEEVDRWRRIKEAYEQVLPPDTVRVDGAMSVADVAARIAIVVAGKLQSSE